MCVVRLRPEQLAHLWRDHPVGDVGAAAMILAHLGVEAARSCMPLAVPRSHLAVAASGDEPGPASRRLPRVCVVRLRPEQRAHLWRDHPVGTVGAAG